MSELSNFMTRRQVNRDIREKVFKYFHYLHKEEIKENDSIQDMSNVLPDNLKMSFQIELYQKIIRSQAFFSQNFSESFIEQLCLVIKEKRIGPDMNLLDIDKDSTKENYLKQRLFFILDGKVTQQIHAKENNIINLEKGDCIGMEPFITGQSPDNKSTFKTQTTVVFACIEKKDFIDLLNTNHLEKEKYFMVKDRVQFGKEIEALKQKCFSCSSQYHRLISCEIMHLVVNYDKLIYSSNKSFLQERTQNFERQQIKQSPAIYQMIEQNIDDGDGEELSLEQDQSYRPQQEQSSCIKVPVFKSSALKLSKQSTFQNSPSLKFNQIKEAFADKQNKMWLQQSVNKFPSNNMKSHYTQENQVVESESRKFQFQQKTSESQMLESQKFIPTSKLLVSMPNSSWVVSQNMNQTSYIPSDFDSPRHLTIQDFNLPFRNEIYFTKDDFEDKGILQNTLKEDEQDEVEISLNITSINPKTFKSSNMKSQGDSKMITLQDETFNSNFIIENFVPRKSATIDKKFTPQSIEFSHSMLIDYKSSKIDVIPFNNIDSQSNLNKNEAQISHSQTPSMSFKVSNTSYSSVQQTHKQSKMKKSNSRGNMNDIIQQNLKIENLAPRFKTNEILDSLRQTSEGLQIIPEVPPIQLQETSHIFDHKSQIHLDSSLPNNNSYNQDNQDEGEKDIEQMCLQTLILLKENKVTEIDKLCNYSFYFPLFNGKIIFRKLIQKQILAGVNINVRANKRSNKRAKTMIPAKNGKRKQK